MPKGKKLSYAVDDFNRLLVKKDAKVYPLEGEFKIEKNKLAFTPYQKSLFTRELDLPKKIKFQGSWHLSKNRDLKLSLSENDFQRKDDELEIRGRIIACEADSLTFEIKSKKTPSKDKFSLLKLGGRWQANEDNELNFLVTKDREEDLLRFSGAWKTNKNQEITYIYEKQDLVRKTKVQETLTFKGYWQINSKDRLCYVIGLKNKSFFEFKVQWDEPEVNADSRQIKYRLGIGMADLKREKVFLLFGRWRIGLKKTLFFELDYGKKRKQGIDFGAEVYLGKNNQFVFELKDRQGEKLGISVAFKRDFFQGKAELFSRISKLEDDYRLEAGMRIPW